MNDLKQSHAHSVLVGPQTDRNAQSGLDKCVPLALLYNFDDGNKLFAGAQTITSRSSTTFNNNISLIKASETTQSKLTGTQTRADSQWQATKSQSTKQTNFTKRIKPS